MNEMTEQLTSRHWGKQVMRIEFDDAEFVIYFMDDSFIKIGIYKEIYLNLEEGTLEYEYAS